MKVEYEPVGIPSEIKIVPPNMDDLKGIIPEKIKIDASEVKIPNIKIEGPDSPIPNYIRFDASEVPEAIDLVYKGQEIPIKVETEVVIKLDADIPHRILVDMPHPIPDKQVSHHRCCSLRHETPASICGRTEAVAPLFYPHTSHSSPFTISTLTSAFV